MHRHDIQDRMGTGSPLTASFPVSMTSSRSGYTLCPAKRLRGLTNESPSTSHGSVVTAILGVTDTFNGRSNSVYKKCLQTVHASEASHEYVSFINEKVADHDNGVWTTGTVQCLHQGILPSMTRTLPADIILPNKSQSFSIVWEDDTDSICDLPSLLTYMDNHVNRLHRTNSTQSPSTSGSVRRASNGDAVLSSLPSSSPLPHHPLPPNHAPAPTSGICGHSLPSGRSRRLTYNVRFFRLP